MAMQFNGQDLADQIVCSLDNELVDDLDEVVKMRATYNGDQILISVESLDNPESRRFRVLIEEVDAA